MLSRMKEGTKAAPKQIPNATCFKRIPIMAFDAFDDTNLTNSWIVHWLNLKL